MAPAKPTLFCLFGATGDLARRKILPALYRLYASGAAPNVYILGVTRSGDVDDTAFRGIAREALGEADVPADAAGRWCDSRLFYEPIGEGTPERFKALVERMEAIESRHVLTGNRVFYLALPPAGF